MKPRIFPSCLACLAIAFSLGTALRADEAYFTDFENFNVGEDTVYGTDGWLGSYYAGYKLHGVMSESQHGVTGIGNAAFIGGYAGSFTKTTSGNAVYLRRPVNLDPVGLGQEIVTFRTVFGIKDSTSTKRDNFEVLIYNQANALLGGLQFDNTTLDTSGKPRRLIYRLYYDTATSTFKYALTSYTFLADTLESLEFRINFRTNCWSASLSDVPIFQDLGFYAGPATTAKNLGSLMMKMAVTTTTTTNLLPGDNYLLFDDYTVRTDPVETASILSRSGNTGAKLTWNEEAAYTYQLEYSDDCILWKSDLTGASSHTATLTQDATFTDPTSPVPAWRFYRVSRSLP